MAALPADVVCFCRATPVGASVDGDVDKPGDVAWRVDDFPCRGRPGTVDGAELGGTPVAGAEPADAVLP